MRCVCVCVVWAARRPHSVLCRASCSAALHAPPKNKQHAKRAFRELGMECTSWTVPIYNDLLSQVCVMCERERSGSGDC